MLIALHSLKDEKALISSARTALDCTCAWHILTYVKSSLFIGLLFWCWAVNAFNLFALSLAFIVLMWESCRIQGDYRNSKEVLPRMSRQSAQSPIGINKTNYRLMRDKIKILSFFILGCHTPTSLLSALSLGYRAYCGKHLSPKAPLETHSHSMQSLMWLTPIHLSLLSLSALSLCSLCSLSSTYLQSTIR